MPEYRLLHLPVVRHAARITEGEVGKEETSDAALFDDVSGRTDDDSWDARLLKMPSSQTHGLVADGSQGDEECHVHLILAAALENFGCVDFDIRTLAVVGRNAVKARCQ